MARTPRVPSLPVPESTMHMARSCWSWGQRTEEEVNGQALATRGGGFHQLERSAQKSHVSVGRDDVGAVGAYRHPVLDLEDLHAGVASDEVGEDTLVVRSQVLYQNKGHTGIRVRGHAGKEGLERRQSTGRSSDADDRESDAFFWFLSLFYFSLMNSLWQTAVFSSLSALSLLPY